MMSMSSSLKVLVAAALAASPTVSVAQACQGSRCVLPLQPNAPPPVFEAPPASVPVDAVAVPVGRRGIGLPLLLLGALALGGLLYLLLDSKDDDDEAPASP